MKGDEFGFASLINNVKGDSKMRTKEDILVEMERKLKESEAECERLRELTNKFTKRTEGIILSLVEDGSEEGHSEFFYRMNSKELVLHEGFLRKLNKLICFARIDNLQVFHVIFN